MKHQGYWADLTAEDFKALDAENTIAVLPVGAIEQHGPHLPVSVDRDLVDVVIERSIPMIGNDLSVLFLPTQDICKSNEHIAWPGTLTLTAETLIQVWKEIGASVARAGVRRMVLLNSHGGNVSTMDIVARDLRTKHGMLVAHCSTYQFSKSEGIIDAHEYQHGIHGGEGETSQMLAIRPHLVKMDKAENFRSKGEEWAEQGLSIGVAGPVKIGWLMQDLNADGVAGNATLATPEKGEALIRNSCEGFVAFLREFSGMPVDHLDSFPDAY